MKYWEIIADKLSASGWTWGCVSAVDSAGEQCSSQTHILLASHSGQPSGVLEAMLRRIESEPIETTWKSFAEQLLSEK
jgi:hypothetical protein